MRVVSLVPSITETLIECGVNVVGRTRYCIHPQDKVESITKVGGTKAVDWQKVVALSPDLVILDKEENTLEMAQSCPVDFVALHIQNIDQIAGELIKLAQRIKNEALHSVAERWQAVLRLETPQRDLTQLPGVLEWWNRPQQVSSNQNTNHTVITSPSPLKILYLIWKDPWMAAGEGIFIQSMLDKLGFKNQRIQFDEKYPQIELQEFPPAQTLLLFSSEPYPFHRHSAAMKKLGYPCALVDGELFSWYGIRSLAFLESLLI